ncbi:hypothetical protein [Pseudonocardia sp.]|jgi:hypothetical protein|uniref:hypothetical protein n=1 Tax=Pseudonocardia sp. TaxID=60912 RepID=UPI0031FDC4CB
MPKWLSIYLHNAALAATRTKNTYLAAQYSRLRPRLSHARALVAVEHSILVAIFTCSTFRRRTSQHCLAQRFLEHPCNQLSPTSAKRH